VWLLGKVPKPNKLHLKERIVYCHNEFETDTHASAMKICNENILQWHQTFWWFFDCVQVMLWKFWQDLCCVCFQTKCTLTSDITLRREDVLCFDIFKWLGHPSIVQVDRFVQIKVRKNHHFVLLFTCILVLKV
jgi:hypothetical protein